MGKYPSIDAYIEAQPETLEHFAGELSGYRLGRGSLQFPLGEPLPKELVIRMVRHLSDRLTD